jgi:type I restriction enzyme S subunit
MSFPRYPTYKASGVDWIGGIPTHWDVSPFKWQIERNDGGVWGDEPDGEQDTIVLRSTEQTVGGHWRMDDPAARRLSKSERASALLLEDDLVVTKSSGSSLHIGKTTIVSKEIAELGCCFSNFMQRVRTKSGFMPKLAWYLMNNDITRLQFDLLSNSTTGLANLNATMIGQVLVAVPPADEQTAITAFLDRETAKIDALVEEQKRLIELLKEKRQAVISQAVTKGLDPSVPMKDSGVAWLGEVPAHWVVMPIRVAARLESGHTPSRSRPDWWENCTVPWFTLADVWQIRQGADVIYETEEKVSELGLANSSARRLPKGTVMLSRTASVGFSAIMGTDMATTQDFANWVCGDKVLPEFLLCVFRSMSGEFRRLMMGSTHNTIYMPDVQALRFALPPIPEQRNIVEHVRKAVASFDGLTNEAQRGVDLLTERRSALISAAVTGKIDVRGLAPQPEVTAA